MKLGDLIFYSATYYNEKVPSLLSNVSEKASINYCFVLEHSQLKPFPHKMVHVEVFTGGETGR